MVPVNQPNSTESMVPVNQPSSTESMVPVNQPRLHRIYGACKSNLSSTDRLYSTSKAINPRTNQSTDKPSATEEST